MGPMIQLLSLFGSELAVRVTIGPLMFASFLAHVVFGCCLHHIDGSQRDAATTVAETASDCGHHHQDRPGQNSDEHRCPRDNCRGCECVFARAETESGGQSWAAAFLAAPLDEGCNPDLASGDRNRAVRSQYGGPLVTVGLHLLHQRFLL